MDIKLYTVSIIGVFVKRYEVHKDEQLVYTARKPSFWSIGDMVVENSKGSIVARLDSKLYALSYKYNIVLQSQVNQLPLRKKIMSNHYTLVSNNATYEVKGNFMSTEYTVFRNEEEVAKVSRKLWRSKKAYGMAIIGEQDDLLLLSILMCIIKIRQLRKNN